MKHLVLYSGGLGSFLSAKIVAEKFGRENTKLIFTDTKSEDEDLYRFIDETIKFLGCELISLQDGRDIWQVFNDVQFMGNSRIDPCSKLLKRELFKKWLIANYDSSEVILYYGIDWEERHRLEALQNRWAPYKVESPLCSFPYPEKDSAVSILNEAGIKIPKLYQMGFEHNNCGGFCVKAGQKQMKLLLEKMPERYAHHEAQQESLFKKIGRHGFITKQVNGERTYLGLKEFREMIEEEKFDISAMDSQQCACFS